MTFILFKDEVSEQSHPPPRQGKGWPCLADRLLGFKKVIYAMRGKGMRHSPGTERGPGAATTLGPEDVSGMKQSGWNSERKSSPREEPSPR